MQSKACIFCGEKTSDWPSYASDYARKYDLCDYHLNQIIDEAVINHYDDEKLRNETDYDKVIKSFECDFRRFEKPDGYGYYEHCDSKLSKEVHDYFSEFLTAGKFGRGEIVRRELPDDKVDLAIIGRIKNYASRTDKGLSVERCEGALTSVANYKRCYRYKIDGSRYCESCSKRQQKKGASADFNLRINDALKLLRGE